jgi:hypothetical protein
MVSDLLSHYALDLNDRVRAKRTTSAVGINKASPRPR